MVNKVGSGIRWILIKLLMGPVYFYKYVISPMTPVSCRHIPSCSQYALEALEIHGPVKGIYLATIRILKCNPWGTHGYDPVPPKKQAFKKKH
jgi:putative membrane protein insertion efficiency factor